MRGNAILMAFSLRFHVVFCDCFTHIWLMLAKYSLQVGFSLAFTSHKKMLVCFLGLNQTYTFWKWLLIGLIDNFFSQRIVPSSCYSPRTFVNYLLQSRICRGFPFAWTVRSSHSSDYYSGATQDSIQGVDDCGTTSSVICWMNEKTVETARDHFLEPIWALHWWKKHKQRDVNNDVN